MKVVVVTTDKLKEELLTQGLNEKAEIEWLNDIPVAPAAADIYIDLLFDTDRIKRKEKLDTLGGAVIIINDVIETMTDLPGRYVRINGWPTFLKRAITEASCNNEAIKVKAEEALTIFNKKAEWVDDMPGFITARVVSTIINEAYFSVEDGVSSSDEIDTAMKLGTSYPYGPFEWSKMIGVENLFFLLHRLSKDDSRYTPSELLKKEANR
ncbi:MAG: 3-hydroxyacyl-CoA dehydrogenase family protein [Bacteroidota bacterium]